MAGRGNGRGNVTMTIADLNVLINDRISAALAAQQQVQEACTYKAFMECKPHTYNGSEGAVGLLQWIEKLESVFAMCNCPQASWVKYASGTLEGAALTWWNANVQMLGLAIANGMAWDEFKNLLKEEYCPRDEVQKLEGEFYRLKMEGSEIEAYTTRSHELAVLCPQMVNPAYKRIELYLEGLVPEIQSMVTSANPTTIQQTIRLAHKLTDQAVAQGRLPPRKSASKPSDNNKRKFDNFNNNKSSTSTNQPPQQSQRRFDSNENVNNSNNNGGNNSSSTYAGKYPKCNKCNYHHNGSCDRNKCQRCGNMGHAAKNCRVNIQGKQPAQQQGNARGCYECGAVGHFKSDCPQLKQINGNGNRDQNNNNQNHDNNNNGET